MNNRNVFKLRLMSILLDILTAKSYKEVTLCDVLNKEDIPGSISIDILGVTFFKVNNESDMVEDILYLIIPELNIEVTHRMDGIEPPSKTCDALINFLFTHYAKR